MILQVARLDYLKDHGTAVRSMARVVREKSAARLLLVGEGPDAYWMAEQISEAYIAFARTGDPNNPKLPHWPAYDLAKRATMVFDKVSKVVNDPRSEPRKMFSQVPYENPGT